MRVDRGAGRSDPSPLGNMNEHESDHPRFRFPRHSIEREDLGRLLEALGPQLEWRRGLPDDEPSGWYEYADLLLTQAKQELCAGKLERAWGSALAAARLEVFGYAVDDLAAVRIALRQEALAKLGSWRQATVLETLARSGSLDTVINDVVPEKGAAARICTILKGPLTDGTKDTIAQELRASGRSDYTEGLAKLLTQIARDEIAAPSLAAERRSVFHAMRIRDEHSENVHRRLALLGRQMAVLSLVLAAALLGVLAMAFSAPLNLDDPPTGARTWIWVPLFGALGGCFTALLSVARRSPLSRIPEQREQWLFTAGRPLIGSAAALVAYALFEAEILSLGPADTSGALLAIAFAAGLSERLVTGALDSSTGSSTVKPE